MSNIGSKGQRSTFRQLSGYTYFLTGYLKNILVSVSFYFVLRPGMMKEKMPRKFEDKLSFIKVSKGRCPKSLDDFVNFSVLYQVGRFTYAFSYQFLVIFLCFGIFPLDRTGFCHLHNSRK